MLPPLPRARQPALFDLAQWRQAQAELSGDLASLTLAFGALEERLAATGDGLRQRLALHEAAELSWWAGHRIGVEHLTLWVGHRHGSSLTDSLALAQAGWAARRLAAAPAPAPGGWEAGLARVLGHTPVAAAELAELMAETEALHPVTQAAILFHAWRLAAQTPAQDIEAAVLAACHAGSMGRRPGTFLPLALAGGSGLRASGSAQTRLASWIRGAEQATTAALLLLDRLAQWRSHARARLADLSGRTPALLIDLLAATPMLTAPLAEAQTGASRAAVQRNLAEMVARGLAREITGQNRYRVWTTQL